MWSESHSSHPQNRYFETIREKQATYAQRSTSRALSAKLAILGAALLLLGMSRNFASKQKTTKYLE